MKPLRIVIADDHAMICDGLKMIIEAHEGLQVVAVAADGEEAVRLVERLQPDLAILDISMPEMNGILACELIKKKAPSVRSIILTMHHTSEYVFRAFEAGAAGYLLKESAGGEMIAAIRTVMKGRRFLGRGVEDPFASQPELPAKSPLASLSRREHQVMQMVVEGKTSAEIANKLSLSPKSVESYRSRLMTKLEVPNLAALVKFALEHGITPSA
ncbi:response regulator transcription factor [Geomonas sp.]|uniref:response regulator transcription factor n=1 Tax=Geomonas sp. TaxID=2651584 RepID=UPI002B475EF9|nr:response regulator transcription factor [Geomonas sp.]HJV36740.1 response regulator transcription factor [Geomonas sp.]